jgi:UDP-N-acetylmuramoylalanine--D-glutamate ligase
LGKKIFFSKSKLITPLVGEHNKENIAAAEAVAKIIGIDEKTVANAVKNFTGLEHRIEFVREKNGVKYFDDSFATTPESAIIALKSFNEPIILLAGGADKGADFKEFAKEISKRTTFVCLLDGKATPRIKKELDKLKFKNYKIFNNFETAINFAKDKAKPKQIVLLSTACASFGMFPNYKERGNLFKAIVKKL